MNRRLARGPLFTIVAALLLYLLLGHAQHPGETMEQAATGAGICLLLVTTIAVVVAARPPESRLVPRSSVATPAAVASRAWTAPLPRTRASPAWLQRFLN
jgi:hypothetical protein